MHGGVFHQANGGENSPQKRRRTVPVGRNRTIDVSDVIGMKDSIIPAAGAGGILRVFADHVEQGLGGAHAQGFGVLRHEQHVAALLLADLVDELRETLRPSQV